MAKFNKDRFINDMTGKVQSAIDRHLITDSDVNNNALDRLHGFIQYELTELISDRKFALDVLSDFNYDEKTSWEILQEKFGKFKTIMDIALVNLWKFLENEGATEYSYYHKASTDANDTLLDKAREDTAFDNTEGEEEERRGSIEDHDNDDENISQNDTSDDNRKDSGERPRRNRFRQE